MLTNADAEIVTLDQLVGNELAIEQVKVLFYGGPHSNLLLHGPSGVGKTTLAKAVSIEYNSVPIECNGSSIKSISHIVQLIREVCNENEQDTSEDYDFIYPIVPGLRDVAGTMLWSDETNEDKHSLSPNVPITLVIDEAHGLSKRLQTELLTLVSEGTATITVRKSVEKYAIDSAKINYMLLTTDAAGLIPALRNRFETIPLTYPTLQEKIKIIQKLLKNNESVTQRLAEISISPRECIRLATRYKKYNNYKNNKAEIQDFLKHIDIDSNGLDRLQRTYLHCLNSGSKSLTGISQLLGISTKDVTDLVETKLIQWGLISIGSGGRTLTAAGFGAVRRNVKKNK